MQQEASHKRDFSAHRVRNVNSCTGYTCPLYLKGAAGYLWPFGARVLRLALSIVQLIRTVCVLAGMNDGSPRRFSASVIAFVQCTVVCFGYIDIPQCTVGPGTKLQTVQRPLQALSLLPMNADGRCTVRYIRITCPSFLSIHIFTTIIGQTKL